MPIAVTTFCFESTRRNLLGQRRSFLHMSGLGKRRKRKCIYQEVSCVQILRRLAGNVYYFNWNLHVQLLWNFFCGWQMRLHYRISSFTIEHCIVWLSTGAGGWIWPTFEFLADLGRWNTTSQVLQKYSKMITPIAVKVPYNRQADLKTPNECIFSSWFLVSQRT